MPSRDGPRRAKPGADHAPLPSWQRSGLIRDRKAQTRLPGVHFRPTTGLSSWND